MKEISIRLNLKGRSDGKLLAQYLPISAKKNGMMEFPVELDRWEVISIDRNSEIKIPDILGKEWEVFENDEITVYGDEPRSYIVEFKEGMFGIDVDKKDLMMTFYFGAFCSDSIQEIYKNNRNDNDKLFIPLAHLNIGGTINTTQAIILTKS